MKSAARSMVVFGVYVVGIGAMMILVPNVLLGLFGFPPTEEIWIRVMGVLTFTLGFYYIQAGRSNVRAFFRWTIWGRIGLLTGLVSFVVLGLAPPILILFGLIDIAGALWTWLAMRGEA